ncbi:Teneurin-4 [Dissostichus eleginoides]|uniref:Teneurin-4 n=2 Tax=Notothenioidei TaxID=8205 RepID=A0AAD9CDF6_DISEL|nr:Teneurin-4 [Dissostichus eleginoides]
MHSQAFDGGGNSPPLHCSSASSSPVEQLPYPPPSIAANESQRGLLGNCAAQPAQDSDSEDEFGPNSFLVKTGSGNLYAPATADDNILIHLFIVKI